MGRHSAAADRTVVTTGRRQSPASHRRPEEWNGKQVVFAPANATRAVAERESAIVISVRFAAAVETIYGELRLAHIPARSLGRIIELVGAKLQERLDLPAWDNVDLRTVLRYLASKRKIHFPEALSASS